jgi:hypothetical protein
MRFALCRGETCDVGREAGTGKSTAYGVRNMKLEVEAGYASQDADDVFGIGGADAGTHAGVGLVDDIPALFDVAISCCWLSSGV